jgi:very-short-patch-repair endonuclease
VDINKETVPNWQIYCRFYCAEVRLCIEIDGKIHELNEQRKYDEIRQIEIEAHAIRVLRIHAEDIHNNLQHVMERVSLALKEAPTATC